MKGLGRRRELLGWLNERGHLSVIEIVERFSVSKMTVHRDLEQLEQRQLLKRVHGGVLAMERNGRPVAAPSGSPRQGGRDCTICQRPVGAHLLYSLTLSGSGQLQYCCPHCGISGHMAYPGQVVMALATDFLTGRPHPAQQSWFVLGSMVVPCCRPSMLTFEDEEMARRFQGAYGGSLGRLEAALDYLQEAMRPERGEGGCCCCTGQEATPL